MIDVARRGCTSQWLYLSPLFMRPECQAQVRRVHLRRVRESVAERTIVRVLTMPRIATTEIFRL